MTLLLRAELLEKRLNDFESGINISITHPDNKRLQKDVLDWIRREIRKGTFTAPARDGVPDPVIERDRLWCEAIVRTQYQSDASSGRGHLCCDVAKLLAKVEELRRTPSTGLAGDAIPIADDVRLDNIWLVWSNEHGAWWRHNAQGYTTDINQAGHYRLEDAIGYSNSRSRGRTPAEIPIRLDIALQIRSMANPLPQPPSRPTEVEGE